MEEKTQDMIDTTDCLEAVSAFKAMKNFFFVLILICLLLLQMLFWLNQWGLIDNQPCNTCTGKKCTAFVPAQSIGHGLLFTLAATTNNETASEPAEEADSQETPAAEPTAPVEEPMEEIEEALELPAESVEVQAREVTEEVMGKAGETAEEAPETAEQKDKPSRPVLDLSKLKIKPCYIKGIIAAANFILLISAVMYCLTLLMTLKVSLTGRLGGINHISRAFFVSLFALVLLFPWQRIIPGVLVGTVYLPKELLTSCLCETACSKFCKVLMYLRFTGLWLVTLWLFLWAQIRSGKWARATLRRLGIMR